MTKQQIIDICEAELAFAWSFPFGAVRSMLSVRLAKNYGQEIFDKAKEQMLSKLEKRKGKKRVKT